MSKMSQKEERRLWKILEECDAEQAREERIALKKKTKKVEKARSKMKVGKNQPSMMDALRAVPARGGQQQSPKTINASGSRQDRMGVNPLTGSESNNIIIKSNSVQP